jgi:hypothetical protein
MSNGEFCPRRILRDVNQAEDFGLASRKEPTEADRFVLPSRLILDDDEMLLLNHEVDRGTGELAHGHHSWLRA